METLLLVLVVLAGAVVTGYALKLEARKQYIPVYRVVNGEFVEVV